MSLKPRAVPFARQLWVNGTAGQATYATIIKAYCGKLIFIEESPGAVPVKRSLKDEEFINQFVFDRYLTNEEFDDFMQKPWHGVTGVKTPSKPNNLWELSKPIRDLLEANPTAGLEVVISIDEVVIRLKEVKK